MKLAIRVVLGAFALLALLVVIYVSYAALGLRAHARTHGTLRGLALRAPVEIVRDGRGVPHIVAHNLHDLFFAQGYVEGSDRLFQMDLLRRFVTGHLAEILGKPALASDEAERAVPVADIVARQWRRLGPHERAILRAFSAGVNAAIAHEPLPVEFRILGYRPALWTPRDSMAVAMATVLDLIDDWNAVADRDRVYRHGGAAALARRFPLSDPCYDAPLLAGLAHIAPGPHCRIEAALDAELAYAKPPVGSNEWAVGAERSLTHRALLANDPHLGLHIPGVWYLIDLRAPGFHAAGATFPGAPGVVLGHNDDLAWGATDGTTTSLSVFAPPATLDPNRWHTQTFRVRFGATVRKRYYRGPRDFGLTLDDGRFALVRWDAYTDPRSPMTAFLRLDRARTIAQALRALRRFPGPTQNFVLADTRGNAAYALAGRIPDDPAWGRWIHPARDLVKEYPDVPRDRLPQVAPSRDAVLWTANNRMYARGYPLRLSAQFATPYRAYRIAQLLRARRRYDVAYFTRMQMDVLSLPERELAHQLAPVVRRTDPALGAALARWDGEMRGASRTATVIERLRLHLTHGVSGRMPALLARLRRAPVRGRPAVSSTAPPWSIAGAIPVNHPLHALGITLLDGAPLAGDGDAFTLHMQQTGDNGTTSQSFRAVWDVGNWDAGGITLPEGESGEPGSGHYRDQAAAWVSGRLLPLPYSRAAVRKAAVAREVLEP